MLCQQRHKTAHPRHHCVHPLPCLHSLRVSLCLLLIAAGLQFVSFFAVAFVAYFLRTVHGYRSLPEAIYARYGGFAALTFGLAVAYRQAHRVPDVKGWD